MCRITMLMMRLDTNARPRTPGRAIMSRRGCQNVSEVYCDNIAMLMTERTLAALVAPESRKVRVRIVAVA
jgi:hypothetical protein